MCLTPEPPTQCKLKSTPSLDQQCLYYIGHLSPLCLTAEIPQLNTGISRMNIRPTGVSFTFFFIQPTKCTCAHLVSDVYEWQKCCCNSGKRHEILNSSNTTEPPRAAPSWLMFVWPLWWCLACEHTFSFPLLGSASGNQVYIKTIKSRTWQHATKGMTQQTGAVLETSNSSSNNIVNN